MLSIPCTHLVHIGKLKTAQGHWLCSEMTKQTASAGAIWHHSSVEKVLPEFGDQCSRFRIATVRTSHCRVWHQGRQQEAHRTAGSYRTATQIKDCPALKLVVYAIYLQK